MKSPERQVRDLRLVQNSGQRAIASIYRGVGTDVARAVRRHCWSDGDGALHLSPAGLALAMLEIDRILAETEAPLARGIIATMREAERRGNA